MISLVPYGMQAHYGTQARSLSMIMFFFFYETIGATKSLVASVGPVEKVSLIHCNDWEHTTKLYSMHGCEERGKRISTYCTVLLELLHSNNSLNIWGCAYSRNFLPNWLWGICNTVGVGVCVYTCVFFTGLPSLWALLLGGVWLAWRACACVLSPRLPSMVTAAGPCSSAFWALLCCRNTKGLVSRKLSTSQLYSGI
jgi:hypothetical protein